MLSKNRFLLLVLILLHAGVVGVGKKKLAYHSFQRTARRMILVRTFQSLERLLLSQQMQLDLR